MGSDPLRRAGCGVLAGQWAEAALPWQAGNPRHLFTKPVGPEARLNRTYVPDIAAYTYLIVSEDYDHSRAAN